MTSEVKHNMLKICSKHKQFYVASEVKHELMKDLETSLNRILCEIVNASLLLAS